MTQERRWLRVKEGAEYIGCHPRSLRRACATGKIPYAKVKGIGIRLDRLELDALLSKKAKPSA